MKKLIAGAFLITISLVLLANCSSSAVRNAETPIPLSSALSRVSPSLTSSPETHDAGSSPAVEEPSPVDPSTPEPAATPFGVSPTALAPTEDTRPDPAVWVSWPVLPQQVSAHAKEIYLKGLALGTDPHAFSVTGDCQAIRDVMLGEFDDPRKYTLDSDELYLQETIDFFQGSFNRNGMAVRGGFNAASVLSPIHADPQYCKSGETPLGCEFRLHNPSILIISLEVWNDREHLERYEEYLRQIIEFSIERGVLPVLMTKADMAEALKHVINPTLVQLAYEYDLPLVNFWLAVQPLPNHGIDPDRDGFHISAEAWKVKSYTALKALDFVWRSLQQQMTTPTSAPSADLTPTPTPSPAVTAAQTAATPIPICNPPGDCVLLGVTHSVGGRFYENGIFILEVPSGQMAQVAGEGYSLQAVSPDGRQMLLNRGQELYVSKVNGTGLRFITEHFDANGDLGAYWQPDGEEIVLIANREGQNVVWAYQPGEDTWRQLTQDADRPISLYPSANAEVIYWESGACTGSGECNSEGVWVTQVNEGSSKAMEGVLKPVFSPDGVHFAFMDPAYTYNEQFNANFKLFVEELDTRMLSRRMVAFPAATGFQVRNNLESYTWSPDSSRLMIFLDERSNYYERSAGYHIFQFILTNGMLLEYERLYGESPRMTWAPDSIRQLFAITQTRAGGGYSVVLSMLDTSTRLTRTYEPGAVLMSEDYIFIDKMFWLPAQND